jgi:phosphatidylglycerol lysyltransferase
MDREELTGISSQTGSPSIHSLDIFGDQPSTLPAARLGALLHQNASRIIAAVTFISGILNLYSVMNPLPHHLAALGSLVSIEFVHLSRSATVLAGFLLVVSSVHLARSKQRAYQICLALAISLTIFHLVKGFDVEAANASALLALVLFLMRRQFTVRSHTPNLPRALALVLLALVTALGYGIAGFWLLDVRHFGVNFHIGESIRRTFEVMLFAQPDTLLPQTHYAIWFLDSLQLMSLAFLLYAGFAIFRPVLYRYQTRPRELARAEQIVRAHGRTAQDFYKFWPDKSFFFGSSGNSFIAYRVGLNSAIALADPVGPSEHVTQTIREFVNFCRDNDWRVAFHQVTPELLPAYLQAGLKEIKIGDEAIVDLRNFRLEAPGFKDLRYSMRRMEREGIRAERFEPPVPDAVLYDAQRVSDEWLQLDGRRERSFTLGHFDANYLRCTPMIAAYDGNGAMHAFVNIAPSFRLGEVAVDLMRRGPNAPNGIMDFLLLKSFLDLKERGFTRFNLGLAPMSGFRSGEQASLEERAIHRFLKGMTFIFNFEGLRKYKAKYATWWEPRYEVYSRALDLPLIALAIAKVSKFKGQPAWSASLPY